jgi:hypothetical protein
MISNEVDPGKMFSGKRVLVHTNCLPSIKIEVIHYLEHTFAYKNVRDNFVLTHLAALPRILFLLAHDEETNEAVQDPAIRTVGMQRHHRQMGRKRGVRKMKQPP